MKRVCAGNGPNAAVCASQGKVSSANRGLRRRVDMQQESQPSRPEQSTEAAASPRGAELGDPGSDSGVV